MVAVDGPNSLERPDRLVTEEPMEIRIHAPGQPPTPLAVTMRTPGNDFELAVGFCLTEQVVRTPHDIATVAYCLSGDGPQEYNVVTVTTRTAVDFAAHQRAFVSNASCGLCGKATLDQVEANCAPIESSLRIARSVLVGLPDALRTEQVVFETTGGVHAAACFSADGELLVLREDIGRHNALDKVIGMGRARSAGSAVRRGPLGLRAHQLRDRAEGRAGGHPRDRCRIGAVEPRGANRRPARHHRRRVPARRALQRVLASRACRPLRMSLCRMNPDDLLALFAAAADAHRDALVPLTGDARRARTDRPGQYALDVVVDAAVLAVLHTAPVAVVSEESGWSGDRDSAITVVVDPVDGSTNCSREIPYWGISLCALDADGPLCSMVTNTPLNEHVTAVRGRGAGATALR